MGRLTFILRGLKHGYKYWFDRKFRKKMKNLYRQRKVGNAYRRKRNLFRHQVFKYKSWGTCALCHVVSPMTGLEVDHIIPMCLGGSNKTSNFQVVCHGRHQVKTLREEKVFNNKR